MTCTTCAFHKILDDTKPHCLRLPPKPLGQIVSFSPDGKQTLQTIVDFVPLNRNIACGEWRAKNEPV